MTLFRVDSADGSCIMTEASGPFVSGVRLLVSGKQGFEVFPSLQRYGSGHAAKVGKKHMSPQGVEHMRTAARTARPGFATAVLTATLLVLTGRAAEPAAANATQPEGATPLLLHELKTCPHKIVFETCRGGNWEIYIMNADGSNPVNLTRTPDADEFYPKASPDGTKLCFVVDEGKGTAKARNLYLMDLDGTQRTKVADNAREPCWSSDSQSIA